MDVPSQEPSIKQKVAKIAAKCVVSTCAHHSCPHHGKLMDVAPCRSGLPEELQELVFTRLPWPQIYRVRILSKGWNQKLMSDTKDDSQWRRACARAQPKLYALLAPRSRDPCRLEVKMFDLASNRWHSTFETSLRNELLQCGKIRLVGISDRGLVCFLSEAQLELEKTPRLVFVCNPLTRVWKQLPPLYGIVQQHKIMVQLIMDHETKHYRVIAVGYCQDPKVENLVNVYHSKTGQWTKVDNGGSSSSGEVVYGHLFIPGSEPAPCSYNFADGRVREIAINFPGNDACKTILVEDHLFCLQNVVTSDGFFTTRTSCIIEEYQAVHCGASWTLLKEYHFEWPLRAQDNVRNCSQRFFASKDFLMLSRIHFFKVGCIGELYGFSGEEWCDLTMPEGLLFYNLQAQICELRLDSVP